MNRIKRGVSLLSFVILSLFAMSAMAAEREEIIGRMMSVNEYESGALTIDVQVETQGLTGPVMRDMSLELADDVKWVICLGTGCAETQGNQGIGILDFYSQFEPYGVLVQGSDVVLVKSDEYISEVWVSIH